MFSIPLNSLNLISLGKSSVCLENSRRLVRIYPFACILSIIPPPCINLTFTSDGSKATVRPSRSSSIYMDSHERSTLGRTRLHRMRATSDNLTSLSFTSHKIVQQNSPFLPSLPSLPSLKAITSSLTQFQHTYKSLSFPK